MTADNACHGWTALEYQSSPQTRMYGPGQCAQAHGSEGWGFESPPSTPGRNSPRRRGSPSLRPVLLTPATVSPPSLRPSRTRPDYPPPPHIINHQEPASRSLHPLNGG